MQKLYFEAEAEKTNNVKIIDRSGATKPKTEGGLTIDEIRYGFKFKLPENNMPNFYWIYIRGNKIYVTMGSNKIANPNETQKILNFLLNDTNNKITYPLAKDKVTGKLVLVIKEAEKYKNLLSTLRTLVKSNQAIIDTETFNKNQTTTATPGQTENKEQTTNTEQKPNEQKPEANNIAETPKTKEIKDIINDENKFKELITKINGQIVNSAVMEQYKNIFQKIIEKNATISLTDFEKIITDLQLDRKKLYTKFFDKSEQFFDYLKTNKILNAEDKDKEKFKTFFENKKISFYDELKNTDLFLEKYLKG